MTHENILIMEALMLLLEGKECKCKQESVCNGCRVYDELKEKVYAE